MKLIRQTKRASKPIANFISVEKFALVVSTELGDGQLRLTADDGTVYRLEMTIEEAHALGKRLTELRVSEEYLNR